MNYLKKIGSFKLKVGLSFILFLPFIYHTCGPSPPVFPISVVVHSSAPFMRQPSVEPYGCANNLIHPSWSLSIWQVTWIGNSVSRSEQTCYSNSLLEADPNLSISTCHLIIIAVCVAICFARDVCFLPPSYVVGMLMLCKLGQSCCLLKGLSLMSKLKDCHLLEPFD